MVIAIMTEAELDEVSELEAQIFSVPWSKQGFLDTIPMPNVIFLVAKEANQVVGYCGIYLALDEGEITNVAVSSDFRHRGIAKELVGTLIQTAEREGIRRFVLEVRASNQPAIRLYEKLGFVYCGTRRAFYTKPVEDADVMVLDKGQE